MGLRWFVRPRATGLSLTGGELVGSVRRLRHGFLNDLQVIRGWLQLGRTAPALEQLDRVLERLRGEMGWSALGDDDLEAALLLSMTEAEGAGVELRVDVVGTSPERGESPGASFPVALWAILRTVIRLVASGDDPRRGAVEVSVSRAPGCAEARVVVPGGSSRFDPEGLEEEALRSRGFLLADTGDSRPGPRGAVGVEWRPAAATWRVAEGKPADVEILLVSAEPPAEGLTA
ncbi:MAG: Spo0B domain-containing protein [Firmicutes bacterium]|nr:Spo0B domain-containing protein [Bacillota bacterium]